MQVEISGLGLFPVFGGADSRCPKCLTRDPETDWCPPGTVHEDATEEIRAVSGRLGAEGGRDLLRRKCSCCWYAWYEIPLDAPEIEREEDEAEAEIKALRALVLTLSGFARTQGLDLPPALRRAVDAVAETEGRASTAVEEDPADSIAASAPAAPFFAPLRKPGV